VIGAPVGPNARLNPYNLPEASMLLMPRVQTIQGTIVMSEWKSMETVKETLENRISRTMAELTAQRIVTDVLIHVLCFDMQSVSRSMLLRSLDVAHNEIETILGHDDVTVISFRERRNSLRNLLTEGAIEERAGMEL
jgi:hypothetical protein